MTKTYVIANPQAGKGQVGEWWERLLAALHSAGLEPLGDLTQHPGHAVDLARDARREGTELVVAAGGDGTVNEVVNGLLADGPGADVPTLGVIALGSGCDYIRTFGIPHELDAAVARLASPDQPREVDAGEITYQTREGQRSRYFANIAEVGLGPEVVRRAGRLPRALGPALYFAAFWLSLPGFKRRRAEVLMDADRYDGPCMNLVVANAQVFGGGMRIAPGADPADGLFDVQVHAGSKLDYVQGIAKVYKGTHLPHPRIKEFRSAAIELRCDPPALVEADGEVLGYTPATVRIHPGALKLKA